MNRTFSTFLMLIAIVLVACQNNDSVQSPTLVPDVAVATEVAPGTEETAVPADAESEPTAVPQSTDTPIPPTNTPRPLKELTICLNALPENIYLYGNTSDGADLLRQAVYEPLYTTRGYGYQAQALQALPNLESGTAEIQTVTVRGGDRVVNSSGQPVTLQSGMQIRTAAGALITYDGESDVEMGQLDATFTFKPLVWSDGTPVTAVDSVFSFNIAADSVTPVDKELIERTAVYEAVDDLTVRWRGLPGYLDRTYFTNVWTPLPSHQLTRFTAGNLIEAEETNQMPLSYGPFMIIAWDDEQIVMERNPHYPTGEGSLIGRLFFVQEPDGLNGVVNGRCHISIDNTRTADQIPAIQEAESVGTLLPIYRQSLAFEHIDFGINPERSYATQRPDWFEDGRVRQAFMHCINRQQMLDELQFGKGVLMDAYVSSDHPLFPDNAVSYGYDPALGNQLLDAVGLLDEDGNGVREETADRNGRTVTTPMSITLGTDDLTPLRRQINEQVKIDLAECGVHVELYELPTADFYGDGPFSPLFGRRFDLATFAWLSRIEPPCNLYLSRNITGPEEEGFGGWSNVNATGWTNEAYDAACLAARGAFPNTAVYQTNHQDALRIFTEELPIIPLFSRVEIVLLHPDVLNFEIDATQRLGLWNIDQIDLE